MTAAPWQPDPAAREAAAWVLARLDELGQIGADGRGGRTRLAFTPEDDEGRRYVRSLMERLGLAVREDPIGNLFGRWEGDDPAAPALLIGSHIDTVPHAGRFDGCLGVIAALAAVRALAGRAGPAADRGPGPRPPRPLEVVAFTGEESSRFGLALIGSRALAGTLDPAALEWHRDAAGVTLGQCLRARGVTPETLPSLAAPRGRYGAYLELHIDQGSQLDDAGCPVGIVTGIAAPLRLRFLVQGEAVHSGAAPPGERKDALLSAAHVLVEVERLARLELPYQTVATVGRMEVRPNAVNVVPGEVEFVADIRGVDAMSRRRLARAIQRAVARVAAMRGLRVEVQVLTADPPVRMDPRLQELLAAVCRDLGMPAVRVPSMAGHDAMEVARICPAGMIFVRNRSRVSHNPREEAHPDDVAAGVAVLTEAVRRLLWSGPGFL